MDDRGHRGGGDQEKGYEHDEYWLDVAHVGTSDNVPAALRWLLIDRSRAPLAGIGNVWI
jgi:hypothetical protein